MSDFFRELIGVKCNISTTDGEYRNYVLRDISNDWIVIEKAAESTYLNLAHIISIKVAADVKDEG
ncbi:DUF2642 domain-containing protein [Ruminococcus albus]|uniref:Conserved domain protein n=1 Tax=Ruminococcus albus 8 TaxID=246199 RepID=E9S853_RUMAL|nr:DUF2642 domain-containing protein [Ruminococcus albus]EGC04616.1 conserved domain protein [Ruminococcus albus 8]MCC3351290.1 DUF2642 domain-containing protein [Ruminococcus albus 8]